MQHSNVDKISGSIFILLIKDFKYFRSSPLFAYNRYAYNRYENYRPLAAH